ncbi:protein of unknown function [Variovorax sp. HW608]|uniref:tyrosine-type recombinase/integrase n=1 Tax=Variovorax sp. HW608 TaxID=1034889 RepID=UPI00082000FB|nr:integrase family protein [Variovorax sp. HW608]SCK48932.1 protein of unknown function [Variovorax sp. HW608]
MPRFMHRLSAAMVAKQVTPGMYADGGNLWLQVTSPTARSWVFRYTLNGRARTLGLGPLHTVSLAQARQKAQDKRAALLVERSAGSPLAAAPAVAHASAAPSAAAPASLAPLASRRTRQQVELSHARTSAASAATLAEAYDMYLAAKGSEWKANRATLVKRRFELHAKKRIGHMQPDQITHLDVLAVIEPIWKTKHPTANDLRGELEDVLAFATIRGMRADTPNPASWKGKLEHALAAPDKVHKTKGHAALEWKDMPAFMAQLAEAAPDAGDRARALLVAIYCQSRSNEIRGMRWADLVDIDGKRPLWALDAEDMKGERKHLVPMPAEAVKIIRAQKRGKPSDLVFMENGVELHKDAMGKLVAKLGHAATPHGLARATFKTWSLEATEFDQKIVEIALAHKVGDSTEGAYVRGGAVDRRAEILNAWAGFLNGRQSKDARVRTYKTAASEKVVSIIEARRKAA